MSPRVKVRKVRRVVSLRRGWLTVYIEPRDLWVGAYVAEDYVYVCPVPMVVFRFARWFR